MQVHTFHGVLAGFDGSRRADRLYVSRDAFVASLKRSAKKYDVLRDGGPGDAALTIDDSTMAGAEACLIARRLGHEVTLFLNPHQIITGQPYFFTVLNVAIDQLVARAQRRDPTVSWRTPKFLELRQSTRRRLMTLSGRELDDEVQASLSAWHLEMPAIPAEQRPINMQTLAELVAAGVQIGNHGWSHVDLAAFSMDDLSADISRAREWLQNATGQSVDHYAVPFGLARPHDAVLRRLSGLCLLVDGELPPGEIAPRLVNRLDVTDSIGTGAAVIESVPAPPAGNPSRTPRISRRALLGLLVAIVVVLAATLVTGVRMPGAPL